MYLLCLGDNIKQLYNNIIQQYNLAGKVVAVVSDNGSNMVKAFKVLDDETDENDEEELDENENSVPITVEFSSVHVRCFCHTLQLAVKDGIRSCSNRSISNALTRAGSIITHVQNSCISTELLEENNVRKLQAANTTRWNSQLTAIELLLGVPADLLQELDPRHCLIR